MVNNAALACMAASFFIGAMFGTWTERMRARNDAVRNGVAEWVLNSSDGSTSFHWKKP